ncbi:alpha/beta fold hydrolase [Streptosporangium minutum]|uniref:Alpha/beta hydrolase n=1 Tax=Streptosporangium minutum TaxID=569862 RepID=A0A243QJ82_9ACTN|nr:alpha/beta hydrolase [Streptosporangium minutum]OUC82108.1 alpha/beta hydrolase [Streptosporangium minutum]
MHSAQVLSDGSCIRWVEIPGVEPALVFVHGLGASSAPYFAPATAHPALAGRRTLMIDMLGFGISDRPAGLAYTLEEHADALAAALDQAAVGAADVVAHSMGGAVAVTLATRHPHLVGRLVLVDANLDPLPPPQAKRPGSSGIAVYRTEQEFLDHGWNETMDFIGPFWAATMRLAGPEALYRSATNLLRGTVPTMRENLEKLPIPRTFLYPAGDGPRADAESLTASGVSIVGIPDCGHNIMVDNPDGFAKAVAEALNERSVACPAAPAAPGPVRG